ncbi:hypothetical protein B0E52_03615 [Rhodanobacter sp. C06]|uniref:hypothetical protein n=1 Tax=Rhodanobacter sp. C06 TaxID=1945854 RepID=UPI0009876FE2|nr:hypothetical protein [Rhodanobacter sp. C06]OOG47477.1 hypothetical protein B0E52_03615 [Rhodanobacter sp. C06]
MWDAEIEQTKRHAARANEIIEKITEQITPYVFENSCARIHVAIPLLKSSIDIAAAATHLLTTDPVQYGSAAEAMYRPQLERYLRAIFFGSPALTTDDEVHGFLENDRMPRRPISSSREIAFGVLADRVSAELVTQFGGTEEFAQQIADAIKLDKKDLHGSVHGGRIVLQRYQNEYVAHHPWALAQGAQIQITMLLAILAFTQVVHLHGMNGGSGKLVVSGEFSALLHQVMPRLPKPINR